jgi:hypothetical protein
MQGERDARDGHGSVYADSLRGVIKQISADLGRDDIHCTGNGYQKLGTRFA